MKFLNRLILIIYSWLMLIISILLCLVIFRIIPIGQVEGFFEYAVYDLASTHTKVLLGACLVFILLSLKCIFFGTKPKTPSESQGVLLENDNGKLMITRETLENLVNSVAKGFEGTEEVHTKIELDRENNVNVYANLIVSTDVVIKELSTDLQNKIKEKVKNATDLEVKEVNIKVKNVAPKEEGKNK